MGKDKPRLGRGLASLLPEMMDLKSSEPAAGNQAPAATATEIQPGQPTGQLARPIALGLIEPNPFQPRSQFEQAGLEQLADSIKSHGLIQPVLLRPDGQRYQLVAGQRRYEAAKLAGMQAIPAIVRELSDQQTLEIALVENIHREDLNCIDRATAYKQYQEKFSLATEQIASRLGQDRTTVINYLRLLALPEQVKQLLTAGRLNMGHARAILGLGDSQGQIRLAFKAAQLDLSVRQVEAMVARAKGLKPTKQDGRAAKDPNIVDLEQQMTRALSTKVHIHPSRRKGSGKIVIEFYSLDDFDRILECVCGPDRQQL